MSEFIHLNDLVIPILRKRRRKTVTIRIKKAQAQVYAPMGASRSSIHAFVASKSSWIQKHLTAHAEQAKKIAANKLNLHDGGSIRVLGQDLLLRLVPDLASLAIQAGDSLLIRSQDNLSSAQALFLGLRAYVMEQSEIKFAALVNKYTAQLGVHPKRISIKEYRSRWGSCNVRKEVQFNWLIALAPPQAMEYVVVHELCHLIHFNHSPAFWSAVGQLMPEYPVWRRWFSTYGESLWSVLDNKTYVN
ncbi:MAG TPA: SprT family zinc-dependent metalloprotease [Cellvibrionaceae bacterium]